MIVPIVCLRLLAMMFVVSAREACTKGLIPCLVLLFVAAFFLYLAEQVAKVNK